MKGAYHPEPYWNEVARKISVRQGSRIIAGDDEPYYRYQRSRFLRLFRSIDFNNKTVLEIGPGPGGNLSEVLKAQPRELCGVDISDEMIAIARSRLPEKNVLIKKTDGEHIPFADHYFDLSFSSTVLQHNTDEGMLAQIVSEMCRVTKKDIYIFEKIDNRVKGTDLCLARPAAYYDQIFRSHNFELNRLAFLEVRVSYIVSGGIRKLFNRKNRKEGEPVSRTSYWLQRMTLPFTSLLDNLVQPRRGVAMLHFSRQ